MVGISYDSVDILQKFATKQKIRFPLLSDPEHQTIADYGLTNKEAKGKLNGVPYPGTILLDSKGVIRGKAFFEGYRERHGPDELLKIAEGIK